MNPPKDKLPYALATLVELANLSDSDAAISRFHKAHFGYLNEDLFSNAADEVVREHVIGLRGSIRKLWRGGEVANQIAREFLLAKEVFHCGVEDEEPVEGSPDAVKVDWDGGKLILQYGALNDFQASIYELLRVSRFARVCARPGCLAPYFIAKDLRTRHCSTDCADAMQDEWRKEWWRTKGKEWLKQRKAKGRAKAKGAKR
jgi:hypothetical protein